jgi:hypothetical protein
VWGPTAKELKKIGEEWEAERSRRNRNAFTGKRARNLVVGLEAALTALLLEQAGHEERKAGSDDPAQIKPRIPP